MGDPRNTGRWRKLREHMRQHATNCAICDRLLDHSIPRATAYPSLDHIHPLAHGGDPFDPNNLQIICTGCNSRKAARVRNGTASLYSALTADPWVL